MRKKLVFLTTCLMVSVFTCGCTSIMNADASDENQYIAEHNAELVNNADEVLIATIDGEDYYDIDPAIQVQRSALQGKKCTVEEMTKQMVEEETLYRQAIKKGLEANDQQIKSYMDYQKEILPSDPEAEALFNEMVKSYGFNNADEYWENEEVYAIYKKMLSIGNYRESVIENTKIELNDIDLSTMDGQNALNNAVDEEIEQIVQNSNVIVKYASKQ